MAGWNGVDASFWWIIPLIMMVLCFFMMRRRWRYRIRRARLGIRLKNKHGINPKDSAIDILSKRYALGEIDQKEYEEKNGVLMHGEP
jgi:uncharacterized membrane protein